VASPLAGRRVVVLPDLFVDAIVALPPWAEAQPRMRDVVRRGGGNVPVGPVQLKLGGNAANTGLALARLGAHVDLIAETDATGLHLLDRAAEHGLGASRVRSGPYASSTLALEFGGRNLMLSHAGPLAQFGPERLTAEDWDLLGAADAVLLANWSQNRKGTALQKALARRLPEDVALYVDTADPRHRGPDFGRLLADGAAWSGVRAWGLNENELRAAAGLPSNARPAALERAAEGLAQRLGCRVDLHATGWASTGGGPHGGQRVRVEWAPSRTRRVTGAGDAWNAGNIAADLLGLAPRERLRLAHEVARRTLTGPDGLPPSHERLKWPAPARPVLA